MLSDNHIDMEGWGRVRGQGEGTGGEWGGGGDGGGAGCGAVRGSEAVGGWRGGRKFCVFIFQITKIVQIQLSCLFTGKFQYPNNKSCQYIL